LQKRRLIFVTGISVIAVFFITLGYAFHFADGFKPSNALGTDNSKIVTDHSDPSEITFLLNKGGIGSEEPKFNMNYGLWLTSNGHIEGGFETSKGENYFLRSVSTYNDGNWHNAIITFDSEKEILKLYVDGEEINNLITNTAKPDNTNDQQVRLGSNSLEIEGKLTGNYTGELDDIQVWDIALTNDQVLYLSKTPLDTDRNRDDTAENIDPPVIKNSKVIPFSGINYADVVDTRDINLNSFTVSVWFNTNMNI
jgi:hypothetical protein